MLEAVIFDLDGTIIALMLPLSKMRNDTKKFYLEKGIPPHLLDSTDGISSSTMKARAYFRNDGMSEEEWQQLQKEVDVVLNKHESDAASEVRLLDGARSVVQYVSDMGLKTAILTNNGREAVDRILDQIDVEHLFDVIQTRNESPNPKPFPDGLLRVLERLDVQSQEAVYVGDATIDAEAAKRADIAFWGVATGEVKKEDLLEAGAEEVFGELKEILPALRKRLNGLVSS